MAEATSEVTQDASSTTEVPEVLVAPAPTMVANEPQATSTEPSEPAAAQEPDAIQSYIDKAFETIQHEADSAELNKFLRAHIKTFREEWDVWTDKTKEAYVHMMASQFVQRKAAAIQISIGNEFKLPIPSAQTTLFESIKQTQVKPQKRQPVLLMPPNLRPTYSLKK